MGLADYQAPLYKVKGTQLVYLENMAGGGDNEDGFLDRHMVDGNADPMRMLRNQRLRDSLVQAIKAYPSASSTS